MIRAHQSRLARALFDFYLFRLFKKHFFAMHLVEPVECAPEYPVLLLPNHSTWWDGFFVYFANKILFKREIYLMMLEEQLRNNMFFSRVGAYSIEPSSYRGIIESIRYTRSLLTTIQNPIVCMFPQGELSPWSPDKLFYKRGVELVLESVNKPIAVCQLAIRCEYRNEQRAEVFLKFGKAEIIKNGHFSLQAFQSSHRELMRELWQTITEGQTTEIILQGKKSINEKVEHIRQKRDE